MADGQLVETEHPIRPGDFLRDELEAREMSQRELADRLGRPVQVINEIIKGRKTITEETALGLERVLGVTAQFWLNLETLAQLAKARARDRADLGSQTAWLTRFPVKEMQRRGWIPTERDPIEQVRELLTFFGVASFDALSSRQEALGLRTSAKAAIDEYALAAWIRQGEIEGEELETAEYSDRAFRRVISEARALTRLAPGEALPRLQAECAAAGVAFVCVEELPKVGANGVARWLTRGRPLLQLNLRYRWSDIFWFSFFHECGHIVSHQQRRIFIDLATVHQSDVEETEADLFAERTLIPEERWDTLLRRDFTNASVVSRFAEDTGIAPGIVVGRLQKEGLLPWNALRSLKTTFEWVR